MHNAGDTLLGTAARGESSLRGPLRDMPRVLRAFDTTAVISRV